MVRLTRRSEVNPRTGEVRGLWNQRRRSDKKYTVIGFITNTERVWLRLVRGDDEVEAASEAVAIVLNEEISDSPSASSDWLLRHIIVVGVFGGWVSEKLNEQILMTGAYFHRPG